MGGAACRVLLRGRTGRAMRPDPARWWRQAASSCGPPPLFRTIRRTWSTCSADKAGGACNHSVCISHGGHRHRATAPRCCLTPVSLILSGAIQQPSVRPRELPITVFDASIDPIQCTRRKTYADFSCSRYIASPSCAMTFGSHAVVGYRNASTNAVNADEGCRRLG